MTEQVPGPPCPLPFPRESNADPHTYAGIVFITIDHMVWRQSWSMRSLGLHNGSS